jgi:serine/threonine-protein kinase
VRAGGSPSSSDGIAGRFDRGEGVGNYRFLVELARDDSGMLYLATPAAPGDDGEVVAVQELRHDLIDDEAAVAAFLDHARLAARLKHPNIVRAFEIGSDRGRRFVAVEYVDGQILQRVVRRAHRLALPLPTRVHLRVVTEVLLALEYAHSLEDLDGTPLGLVHGQVSPQSVSITYEGQVKLLDFGMALARRAREDVGGTVKGKSTYVAPECLYGQRVDGRADIFAVGAMLYEAMLWSGSAGSKQSLPPHGHSDAALLAIVQRAMSGDPEARYPTASSMREDLERYASSSSIALPDARELSTLLSSLFAQEHQRQQAFIEERLRAVGEGFDLSPVGLPEFLMTPSVPPVAPVMRTDRPPASLPLPLPPPVSPPRPAPPPASLPSAPPSASQKPQFPVRYGIASAVATIMVAGSVVLFAAAGARPLRTSEVPSNAPPRAGPDVPIQATPTVEAVQPQAALVQAPTVPAASVQTGLTQAAPLWRARVVRPPPPQRAALPPSLSAMPAVASASPQPAVQAPPAPSPSLPISVITPPAARPVREIRKDNPYLQ